MSRDHIQVQFERFHRANPHVLTQLEEMIEVWLERGHSGVGIGMLWEVLRWNSGVSTTGDTYRLNNNYRSRYVRLILEKHPEWEHYFQTRSLASEAKAAA